MKTNFTFEGATPSARRKEESFMENRYIERYRLPQRLYAITSPLVLQAGVLYEDTKIPRLVVQLKFKSISPRTISEVQVVVRPEAQSGEPQQQEFTYGNLRVKRGCSFGAYYAIALPLSSAGSFSAHILSVTFANGAKWTGYEATEWNPLSAFERLEDTFENQEALDTCRKKLLHAEYAYAALYDLWYCTCGGVNRDEEPFCHRCAKPRTTVAPYANPAALQKTVPDDITPSIPPIETLPVLTAQKTDEPAAPVLKSRKKLILTVAGLAIVAIAAILIVPGILDGNENRNGSEPGRQQTQGGNSGITNDAGGAATQDRIPGGSEEASNMDEPVIPEPTLPAPNLYWGNINWPGQLGLVWDWDVEEGLSAEDYRSMIEFSRDGGEFERVMGWRSQRAHPLTIIPQATGEILDGEYIFRISVWRGADTRNIDAISFPATLDIPIYIQTMPGTAATASNAAFFLTPAENNIMSVNVTGMIEGRVYLLDGSCGESSTRHVRLERVYNYNAAEGRIGFRLANEDLAQPGSTMRVWEILEDEFIGGRQVIALRPVSDPLPISVSTLTDADRLPPFRNVRLSDVAPWGGGGLGLYMDISGGTDQWTGILIEFSRDGGDVEQLNWNVNDVSRWSGNNAENLGYMSLDRFLDPGVYSDFRLTNTGQRHPLQLQSTPTVFDFTLTVTVEGQPLPFGPDDIGPLEGSQYFGITAYNLQIINPGRYSLLSLDVDALSGRDGIGRSISQPGSQRVGTSVGDVARIPGTGRATLQDLQFSISGNNATVRLTPPQSPPIPVPEW